MMSSNPFWDTRTEDTSIHDLIRMEYEEIAALEGEIGFPDELLSPPMGFIPNKRGVRRGYAHPKKFIPTSLDEIEPSIK